MDMVMNEYQRRVAEFNEAVKTPRGATPEMRAEHLRARLLIEEALEFVSACGLRLARIGDYQVSVRQWHEGRAPGMALHEYLGLTCQQYSDLAAGKLVLVADGSPDFVKAIDALMDVLYVTFGACDAFGIDADPFFAEVHRTNMAKLDGPTDEFGKRLKPEGWTPPDIARLLRIAQFRRNEILPPALRPVEFDEEE